MTIYGITVASGQLGRLTTEALVQRVSPEQLVLITRSPGTLAEYAARGIEVRAETSTTPTRCVRPSPASTGC